MSTLFYLVYITFYFIYLFMKKSPMSNPEIFFHPIFFFMVTFTYINNIIVSGIKKDTKTITENILFIYKFLKETFVDDIEKEEPKEDKVIWFFEYNGECIDLSCSLDIFKKICDKEFVSTIDLENGTELHFRYIQVGDETRISSVQVKTDDGKIVSLEEKYFKELINIVAKQYDLKGWD